jgi:parvulin-like peptidyl-prolyl isomerase
MVGDRPITRARLEQALARHTAGTDPATVLDELIVFEALLTRAREAGLDRDPALLAAWEQMLVTRYEARERAAIASPATPPNDTDIEAYYRAHPQRFAVEPQVRAAVIFLKCSPKATAERRAALESEAAELLTRARNLDRAAFDRLVRERSDEQVTRYTGGDTGWLRRDPATSGREPALLEALFALEAPGQYAPVVAGPDGFYVARLTERQPGGVRPLEEVREAIRYQLSREREWLARAAFHARAKEGLAIHIERSVLESIRATSAVTAPRLPTPPAR